MGLSFLLIHLASLRVSAVNVAGDTQRSLEGECDKKGGRTLGPPGGNRSLMLFIDDVSLPAVNQWGDQPPLELLRQVIEGGAVYNLSHDRRGETLRFDSVQVMLHFLECFHYGCMLPFLSLTVPVLF